MDISRHSRRTKVATSKRVTYALAGAGLAVMALPLVTAILPQEAGASRVPSQVPPTSVQVTESIVPTNPTVPRSTLAALSGTVQVFNPGLTTYTVSTGICTVEVIVNGAAGGNVQAGVAGRGSSVKGQFAVAAGEKYDLTVGAYRGGGAGGTSELNGGGATKIVKQSTAALVVESGGGGGDSLIVLTRSDANRDTIPVTTLTGSTTPPFIKVVAIPGKGADAPGTTAVTPVNATVVVPVVNNVAPTSTSTFVRSANAASNGAGTAEAEAILGQEINPGTTVQLAKVKVNVYAGGAGGGGNPNGGGASANAGDITSSTNVYEPTTTINGETPPTSIFNAPYAVGAAVGGSGGFNNIGNGFLKTAEGVNDQKDGKVTLREIACSAGGSTLPPLGGGRGANGPLLPFAIALMGAGVGLVLVRRRNTADVEA